MKSRVLGFLAVLFLSSASFAATFLDNTCVGQRALHFRHFTKFQFNNGVITKYHENGTISEDPERYSSMTDFLIKRKVCREAETPTPKINDAHKEILRASLSGQDVLENPCLGKPGMHFRHSQLFVFEKGRIVRYLDDGSVKREGRPFSSMGSFLKWGRVCLEASKSRPAMNADHEALLKGSVQDDTAGRTPHAPAPPAATGPR